MLKGMTAIAALHNMISPSRVRLDKNSMTTFSATGTAPFTWSLSVGSVGSINSSTGVFTAGAVSGAATIIAVDANSITAQSYVYVADPVTLDQGGTLTSLEAGQDFQFTASDGVPPYVFNSFNLDTSQGSLDQSTGILTIDSNIIDPGSCSIEVTDNFGNPAVSLASVSYVPAVGIFPTSGNIEINGTQQFTGFNGLEPYTWSVVSGGGSIDSNGLYTAPATGIGNQAIIRITSNAGSHSDATMTLISDLALGPNHHPETVLKNTTRQFTASLGTSPYSYSVQSGIGSINSSGLYTAPNSTGNAVLRTTDSATSPASVDLPINISPFIDRSISFDGVDDYLNCGNILSFIKTNTFSISAWVYVSEDAFNTGSEIPVIGRTHDLGSGSFSGWIIYGLSSWYLILSADYNAGDYLQVQFLPANLVIGGWNHMVMTYDGSNTAAGVKFYMNGVAASQGSTEESLTGSIAAADNCEMGRFVAQLFQLIGNLCSVSIYNIALSEAQASALYNSGEPGDVTALGSYANCLDYWKLGQGDTYPNLTDTKSAHTAVMTNMSAGDIVIGAAP